MSKADYNFIKDEKTSKVIKITILAASVNELYASEFAKIAKNINIPGFRKGNVPAKLVEEKYGQGIRVDCFEKLLNKQIAEIAKSCNLSLATNPNADFDAESILQNKDVEVTLTFTVFDEIPDVSLENILVHTYKIEPSEDDVKKSILRFREQYLQKEEPAEGRASQSGDSVNIDFKGMMDGIAFEGGTAQGHKIVIGSKSFIDGFEDQLIGRMPGETFEVHVTFPQNYGQKNLAGKPAVFEVKLNSIASITTGEMTDEALKQYTKHQTIEEFENEVRQSIQKYYDSLIADSVEDHVSDLLADALDFEIPSIFVSKITEDKKAETIKQNQLLPEGERKSELELVAELEKSAKKDIMLTLYLQKFAAQNVVAPTDEEVYRYLMEDAAKKGISPFEVFQYYQDPKHKENIKRMVQQKRIYETLYSKITKKYTNITSDKLQELVSSGKPLIVA